MGVWVFWERRVLRFARGDGGGLGSLGSIGSGGSSGSSKEGEKGEKGEGPRKKKKKMMKEGEKGLDRLDWEGDGGTGQEEEEEEEQAFGRGGHDGSMERNTWVSWIMRRGWGRVNLSRERKLDGVEDGLHSRGGGAAAARGVNGRQAEAGQRGTW